MIFLVGAFPKVQSSIQKHFSEVIYNYYSEDDKIKSFGQYLKKKSKKISSHCIFKRDLGGGGSFFFANILFWKSQTPRICQGFGGNVCETELCHCPIIPPTGNFNFKYKYNEIFSSSLICIVSFQRGTFLIMLVCQYKYNFFQQLNRFFYLSVLE